VNWRRRFDDPIPLPDGRTIRTLSDARDALEGADPTPSTDLAVDVLDKAAQHGGPFLFMARIAIARALLGDNPPPIGRRRLTKAEQFKIKRAEYLKRKKNPPSPKG
jgi:hypothetical protein